MESSTEIESQALAWLGKRDSGSWTEADQAELAQWLRASMAHRVAFLRREAAWERSERLKVFGIGREAGAPPPPPGEWRASPFFNRRPASTAGAVVKRLAPTFAAGAATLVLVAGVGFYWAIRYAGNVYSTTVGSYTSIPLRDGSMMTLNTDTKVRVQLTQKERRIELESGEAFFDVAKDFSRPFVVDAGNRKVVAVGTQFSVRREGTDVQVIVTDGAVRVEPEPGHGRAELLAAGAVGRTVKDSLLVQKKTSHEAEEALSWRTGYLTFDETVLTDAITEFNRYTSQPIVIEDPQLATLRITGTFRASHARDFVELLKSGFGVQAREDDKAIHLRSKGSLN